VAEPLAYSTRSPTQRSGERRCAHIRCERRCCRTARELTRIGIAWFSRKLNRTSAKKDNFNKEVAELFFTLLDLAVSGSDWAIHSVKAVCLVLRSQQTRYVMLHFCANLGREQSLACWQE